MPTTTKTRSFKVASGNIVCGDPCYEYPEVVAVAVNGDWVARVEKTDAGAWGLRVKKILVHHPKFSPIGNNYKVLRRVVSVDSGQAGVFDLSAYNRDRDVFYDACCKATLSASSSGFISNGFVSSSGYGDGAYDCVIYTKDEKAVAVEITFIVSETDDED